MPSPAAPIPPRPPASAPRWRDHLVAALLPLHLLAVLVYVAPNPPRVDDEALRHPDVAEELGYFVHDLRGWLRYGGSEEELKGKVVEAVRAYGRSYGQVRAVAAAWLGPVGLTQSWLMFAGTPPRHPRVMTIQIRPRGEAGFTPWLDGRWGQSGDEAFNFRHRKAQNKLSIAGSKRRRAEYAEYWARRWDEAHPDRPAEAVRLSYLELHTRAAAQVKRGDEARPPDERLVFEWPVGGGRP